jgi:signal transduction protein with GAF and PtsI domain
VTVAEAIDTARDLEQALGEIVVHFAADSGTIHRLAEDGQLHLAAATAGLPEQVMATIRTIPVGKGMAGLAVEQRRPIDACNIQTDSSGSVRPGARATGLAGAIVVQMFSGSEVVGALGIGNRAERNFSAAEVDALLEAGRALATKINRSAAPA